MVGRNLPEPPRGLKWLVTRGGPDDFCLLGLYEKDVTVRGRRPWRKNLYVPAVASVHVRRERDLVREAEDLLRRHRKAMHYYDKLDEVMEAVNR